jgi:hypothetical protein
VCFPSRVAAGQPLTLNQEDIYPKGVLSFLLAIPPVGFDVVTVF